uniref:DNA polymerase eta n=1 Tax=Cacopsylla melanoneura TaxID=428564 RepID=A0A8D8MBT3_9HEMI
MNKRIVALIDMDCFYCQVECKLNPSLCGKPLAVVQYNQWKGGGIIAVNYEARKMGVTRHMRGDEAKQQCPDIELCRVPSVRGKADISKFRNAGREVIAVLSEFSNVVERASIDEAYIDLTDVVHERIKYIGQISVDQLANTFVVGFGPDDNDEDARNSGLSEWLDQIYNGGDTSLMENTEDFLELAVAGVIVEEIRAAVLSKTQFHCSAGIAYNKCLAKLVCGLHKPQKQSILPHSSVPILYSSLPVQKVRHLGGKLGYEVMEKLGINTMMELEKFSLKQLQGYFDEKTGTWLYNIARGLDNEPVNARLVAKSIGCCKRFPGKTCLATRQDVVHWIQELADEMCERLEDDLTLNKRRAQLLTVSFAQEVSGKVSSFSRSTSLTNYKLQEVVEGSLQVINKTNSAPPNADVWSPPLFFLGLSASKFSPLVSHQSIQQFFKPQDHLESLTPSEPNTQPDQDRKLTDCIHKFTRASKFQVDLKNTEKRLIDKFKNEIDSKLIDCNNKNVNKIILEDIAQQIKSIATEKVRLYLKSFYSEGGKQNDEEWMKERMRSIEQETVEKVSTHIKESLRDINDIFFVEKDQDLLDDNGDMMENEKVPTCSTKVNQCETLVNCLKSSEKSLLNAATANIPISPCSSIPQLHNGLNISSQTQWDSTKDSGVSPVFGEQLGDTFTLSKHTEVITYTRRQVNPESISDSNSIKQTDENSSQPVIITKPIDSFHIPKYELAKNDESTSIKNMVANSKIHNTVKNSEGNNDTNSSYQPTHPKKTGRYSNSFFNKFLQRKRESEKSSLTSRNDEDCESIENSPEKETNDSKLETFSNINVANHRINMQTKNSTPVKNYEINYKADAKNKFENFVSSSSVTAELKDSSDGRKSMFPESDFECGNDRFQSSEINSDAKNCDTFNDCLENRKRNDIDTPVSVDTSSRGTGILSSLDESNFNGNSDSLAREISTAWSANSKNLETKITCDKCNQQIAMDELQEHQDYHFALELSNSTESGTLAPSTRINTPSSSTRALSKKSTKRGRPSKISVLQNTVNVKKLKTIDEFFKRKQDL